MDNINPLSDAVGGVGWWVLKPRVVSRPSSLDGPDTEVAPSFCTTNPVVPGRSAKMRSTAWAVLSYVPSQGRCRKRRPRCPARSANSARVRSVYPACRS